MTIERVRDAIWQAINPDGGPSPAMAPLVELYERAARAAMQAAAAPEAPEAPSDAWQPIETAPRDGTRVLLARAGIEAQHTAFWSEGVWRCGNQQYFNKPTHWRPLPPPPQTGGK
jgi:hypothetical protein